jgi:hypothetical protein
MQAASMAKLNYMWGTAAPGSVAIHHPNWICNYDAAKQAATANPGAVVFTWIWGVRVRSALPATDPNYMRNPATFALGNTTKLQNPQQDPTFVCNLMPGWVDPNDPVNAPQFGAATPVGPGVWRVDWTYQVEYDVDVGIPKPPVAPPPPPGTPPTPPVMHTIYVRDFFVMFGIDTGGSDVVRNPANWPGGFGAPNPAVDLNLTNTAPAPPRPFRLDMRPNFANATYDTRQVPDVVQNPPQPGAYQFLSLLGVAHVTSQAVMWPGGFVSGDPSRNVIALAQAHVFNNQSWDLWTQHWEAQLEPIDSWDYWINQRMKNATAGDFTAVGGYTRLSAEDFNAVLGVLEKYPAEMADKIKTH